MIEAGQIYKENDPRMDRWVIVRKVDFHRILIQRVNEDGSHYKGSSERWAMAIRFGVDRRGGYSLIRDAPR